MPDRWDDEQLLSALRQAIDARRAVPPGFVQAAKDAFTWHNIDAELASLTYDSVRGEDALTRGEDASIRALTFSSTRLTIELEVTAESLLGQVIPIQVTTIEIQTQAGASSPIVSDEIGCFSIQGAGRPVQAAMPGTRRNRRANRLGHLVVVSGQSYQASRIRPRPWPRRDCRGVPDRLVVGSCPGQVQCLSQGYSRAQGPMQVQHHGHHGDVVQRYR